MASARIDAGICGFSTRVTAETDGEDCRLAITSECPHVMKMAAALDRVDPFGEIGWHGEPPRIHATAAATLPHAACPVPAGIVMAVEVASGLALPRDASIRVSSDNSAAG